MARVTFDPHTIPPQIDIQSSGPLPTVYEKSPYPVLSCDDQRAGSEASSIGASYTLTCYLNSSEHRPQDWGLQLDLVWKSHNLSEPKVTWTYSYLTVDENWDLVRLHPDVHPFDLAKRIHAPRLYIEFDPADNVPGFDELDALDEAIRKQGHGECATSDIAIEFSLPRADRIVSVLYLPKPDKKMLKRYFEQEDSDSDRLVSDVEMEQDL
ncbi:hypothetical protein F4808DRAFT_181989 [Astrocystis sublimbata]|nr:hypothetical protein F4808DRAFT_181989 [Astrocystis sublimbata]